jgi:hypothetical protein
MTIKKKSKKIVPSVVKPIFIISEHDVLLCEQQNEEVRPVGLVDWNDLLAEFSKEIPYNSGFLDKNIIYTERKTLGDGSISHLMVLEFDPKKYILKYNLRNGRGKPSYEVSLPFIQFYVRIVEKNKVFYPSGSQYISCTKKAVKAETDVVYALPCQNIHADGHICWGQAGLPTSVGDTPFLYAKKLFSHFFSSDFITDLSPVWPKEIYIDDSREDPRKNLEKWAALTKEDSNAWMNLTYMPYVTNTTCGHILKSLRV